MSDRGALAQQVFAGFYDAEVVLIALAINSGARFRGNLLEAGLAERMSAVAVDLVCEELRRREVDTNQTATRLFERLLEAMLAANAAT